jgi:hypothetical protein
LLLNIALGFSVGDVEAALASPMGNPAAAAFLNAAGWKGGLAMYVWPVLIQFFTGKQRPKVTPGKSIAYEQARNHCHVVRHSDMFCPSTGRGFAVLRVSNLPNSAICRARLFFSWPRTLRKMNRYTQTPLYSVWVVVVFCCCLNLIALGSPQTINGIFGVTAPAMDMSYIAVIAARMFYNKKHPITPGPFNLGRFQQPINLIAIIWTCFISVILFFPPTYPVTVLNMNWAVVVAGFIALFALSWWYAGAKRYGHAPVTKLFIDDNSDDYLGNTPDPALRSTKWEKRAINRLMVKTNYEVR